MREKLFKNKYRIDSARLPDWDYGFNGCYFITICTKNREHFFGRIRNGFMCLNQFGAIAHQLWFSIVGRHRHVYADAFVVMPNHIHGVLIIDHDDTCGYGATCYSDVGQGGNNACLCRRSVETLQMSDTGSPFGDPVSDICNVSTTAASPPHNPNASVPLHYQPPKNQHMSSISPPRGSISTIIRSYKSACTKTINTLRRQHNIAHPFNWQERFYDRIIRDEEELRAVRQYIYNNPKQWWRYYGNA